MNAKEVFDALRARFGEEKILAFEEPMVDPFIVVAPDAILEVMTHLRDDHALQLDFLSDVTGIDWPEQKILESVYHLYSMTHHHLVVIKVKLPRENPVVESVAHLWPAADWHEREQYDLLGIIYKNHPNLRRILLAEDWEGHPLRKDYATPDEVHGVSTLP